ncbi:hypothetical protein CERZMDRAFT_102796 [Cercospora zeae-maydis SCOH1-5]|uniref:Carrier domain-containing protein n=1 Tax=Cercospora zeae-maydis SCOH1-5 TaxID=717836 RepID=A0A6A6F1P1_9PEZI|nr:hypothetical protein CERZMDRAFT_102796 [Cercospora zeae-maydis SCOH1-5]
MGGINGGGGGGESVQATDAELEEIWHWNASVPLPVDGCVHDLIHELAKTRPNAPAVAAWDGNLSYCQLDAQAGRLAYVLASRGVMEGDIVAIFLKKSKWTPVAMLGIIKAGATAVTLDTNHPTARLNSVLEQTNARFIITSSDLRPRMLGLDRCQPLELDASILGSLETDYLHCKVVDSRFVYISFTSGTTGQPKGACMSHTNVRSAVHYQGKSLGFHHESRVLDFAPYSFDVAWSNFLHTVCAGGCICIAREEEMLEDLAKVISSYRCTLLNITPTVLRTVHSDSTTLETILLSGEPPYPENVSQWAHRVRLLNTYGPTECTFKAAFALIKRADRARPSIGRGVGSCTWLVNPDDSSQLVSLDSVGELYLEGPLVGQGYLGNPALTQVAFVVDPPWLLQGCTTRCGRRGKLYRTGDLARYDADGQLVFMGRKDTAQVKVRGQRVEIADVEHHARASLPQKYSALVDVVRPADTGLPALTLFVETAGYAEAEIKSTLTELTRKLANLVPSFMLPTLYYPVDHMPLAATGKADRRALRDQASAMTTSQLLIRQATILDRSTHVDPETDIEQTLLDIWAEVLHVSVASISTTDNFLRLGGDSVKAIQMISAARQRHLTVSTGNIFQALTLRDLAKSVQATDHEETLPQIEPFSLLEPSLDRESVRRAAAMSLKIDTQDIEDIFPCTPMQQGMMAMTSMHAGTYVWNCHYRLDSTIELHLLRDAWLKVIDAVALLRSRIVPMNNGDLVHVVLRQNVSSDQWSEANDEDLPERMGLGTPLFRLSIQPNQTYNMLNMQMHHAVFDGWSRALILRAVEHAYHCNLELPRLAPFQPFVDFALKQIKRTQTTRYWEKHLLECEFASFPPPATTSGVKLDMHVRIEDLQWPRTGVTPSSVIRAAVALLVAKYTNSDDIMFGATVSGRHASVPGVEWIAGPTFAVVPVRVKLDWEKTVHDLQLQLQQQMIETHEYEQYGLQNIKQAVDGASKDESGLFQLLLVVQQQLPGDEATSIFSRADDINGLDTETLVPFNSHGMMLVANPSDSELSIDVSFDTASLSTDECSHFVKQLEHVLRLLCSAERQDCKLQDMPLTSASDLQQALEWSGSMMPLVQELAIDLVRAKVETQPDRLAVDAHDAKLTYRSLWRLSSHLVEGLRKHSIRGCKIPLCFDKSSWMIVAMLAVLRAGGTAVPVSSSIPTGKARHIVDTCNAAISISSRQMISSSPFTGIHSVLLVEDILFETSECDRSSSPDIQLTLSTPAIVVFTSGTTNSAKSLLWSHRTLSSNVQAAIDMFELGRESRIMQFAAYDFDVSIIESLAALCAGACLCIPNQCDLSDRLTQAINYSEANWICLTPSVANLVDHTQIPNLRTIVLAGEKVMPTSARTWIDSGLKVIVWYGPAEAPVATSCLLENHEWPAGLIGRSKYARIWILDLRNSTQLAPIGAVGELCIEGPVVAQGYMGSTANDAFCQPAALETLLAKHSELSSCFYRTGDYVKFDGRGNLVFIGRVSDSWVKVHGRRIQLSVVEDAAQAFLGAQSSCTVAADVAAFADGDSDYLVLFVCSATHQSDGHKLDLDNAHDIGLFSNLQRHLKDNLPAYTAPTYLIPVNRIPLARTGKTDRRMLRRFANTVRRMDVLDLSAGKEKGGVFVTHAENVLAEVWALILGIHARHVHRDDHFFRLGGDSIAAMRLVTLANRRSFHLTTAQVFQNPTLRGMAAVASAINDRPLESLSPFSLLSCEVNVSDAISAAAGLCNVSTTHIVNMYPCTALQEGLLALTARNPGQYVSRSVLDLQEHIDSSQLRLAWLATVEDLCILRTRIIDLPGKGLVQVVLKDLSMRHGSDVEEYLQHDQQEIMSLGDALCRAALIGSSFILTIHHSIYDGTLLSMLLNKLEARYFSIADVSTTPFDSFVRHISCVTATESADFWRRRLLACEGQSFPQLAPEINEPRANQECSRNVALSWPHDGSTPSIVIQSAWAVLSARFSMDNKVVFGTVLSGRQIDLPGVEYCAGPTVCTVPIATIIEWSETVATFQARLRELDLEALPYQHYGVHNIATAAGKTNPRELFQTLLVVHPASTGKTLQSDNSIFKARSFGATLASLGTDPFNAHALMISCWLNAGGMRLVISFDNRVLTETQVQMLMGKFEQILQNMCDAVDASLDDTSTVSAEDLALFWSQRPSSRPATREVLSGLGDDEANNVHVQYDSVEALKVHGKRQGFHDEQSTSELRDRLGEQAAWSCGIPIDEIEDVYPCTPMQESLVALSERRIGDYVGHDTLQLAPLVELSRFRDSWEAVVRTTPILRTRIVEIPGEGFVQVVSRDMSPWSTATSLDEFAHESRETPISLGCPLTRYGLVRGRDKSGWFFVLTMHHAAYDGITNILIREALDACYHKQTIPPLVPFRHFVNHIVNGSVDAELAFWSGQFQDLDVQHFPPFRSSRQQPRPDSLITTSLEELSWRGDDILPSTIVRAAWAVVCSRYSGSQDVVFGTIVSGRQASLPDVDRVCGPTIAALPVRVLIGRDAEVGVFLQAVQAQALEMIPFEQSGTARISGINDQTREACNYRSMLVIQPEQTMQMADSALFITPESNKQSLDSYHRFNSHALMAICTLGRRKLSFQLSSDSGIIDECTASLLAGHFSQIVRQLCEASHDARLSDLGMITDQEREQIWRWNPPIEPSSDTCVHELIARVARKTPDAMAISAWDGNLTYQELDSISDSIAQRILELDITGNQVIPICFEKSMRTTAAFLGVAKAGHAVLILEPSLPQARLQDIMLQVKPEVIITSEKNRQLCSRFCKRVLSVDTGNSASHRGVLQLPYVKSTDTLYIIFTSGSTGTPKGCMISHGNMSSAVSLQKPCHRLNSTSRMYDFSSYSFDAHHWCLIHTLCAGGTLCVPSETQRQDQLLESLQSYQVTDLLVTPATARMIDPASIPTLRNAIIVGDRIHGEELASWAAKTHLTYAYGPSETSCWATSWVVPCPVPPNITIGKGNGQVTWIVDPHDFNRLSPIGIVGSRASFIDSPVWLTNGCKSVEGRRSRVYRTGDLVKYDPANGNIIFVGRKDNQVKLNGRRIELGDLEKHLINGLARRMEPPLLVAEVVTPRVLARPVLVVFLQTEDSNWEMLQSELYELRSELLEQIPSYMIPAVFVPLPAMPINASGKVNRRRLRQLGENLDHTQLAASPDTLSVTPPSTDQERRLQQMWSQVLHTPVDTLGRDSNYFRAGGDSITAMQLMSVARRHGFSLAVSEILERPCLKDMAAVMQQQAGGETVAIKPFSLLNHPSRSDEIRREVARQCGVSADSVEDCYPCTAVQKSLLAVTSKRPGDCIARIPIQLADNVDLPRLQEAWEQVSSAAAPILRNRMVAIEDEGFVQAQFRLPLEWSQFDSIESFLKSETTRHMGLGTSLTRLSIVKDHQADRTLCILVQHHAIYDGISIALLLDKVSNTYKQLDQHISGAPFQRFIHHIRGVNKDKSKSFWRKQFSGCKATSYPDLPREGYQPQANSTASTTIAGLAWPKQNVTPAVSVRTAWAILSGCYTDSEDVVFGVLSTGRHAPVDGIEDMVAPLIAALPVRVLLDSTTTVHQLLSTMQAQSIEMTPYEQTDLADIQASSEDAASGARFNALLVIQHSDQAVGLNCTDGPFERIAHSLHDGDLNHFNPHAAMIMFQLDRSGGLRMEINFDSHVIAPAQADLLLSHFERILRQVCAASPLDLVKDISPLSKRDVETLWQWNAKLPAATSACVHDLIASTVCLYPDGQALCSWDGVVTYRELDLLSNNLAQQLRRRGVTRGTVIPLCFEKSMWQPIAALGAMKAGAACVSVDCTQPEGRLRSIFGRIEPKFILSSATNQAMAQRLYSAEVVVVAQSLREEQPVSNIDLPPVSPNDILYVVFTSGSTGLPKGVVTTHQNFASAATHQKEQLRVSHGTRVFDFVSYSFDVAWSNLLHTLMCGGCLCIPSESERKNDIPGAFNRLRANYSYFTPTVARSLNPLTLPELRTLAMGGEPIPATEISRWRQVEAVVGIYGPAECAQALCFTNLTRDSPPKLVGRSFGARTWLVEPGRVDRLAAIGAVGELVIEGPAVAMGYWSDEETTNASFLASPPWLEERVGTVSRVYKTGDLLRYNAEDGSLTFVGRKDQMVKLRGQRIELSEVEHHVQKFLRAHTSLCKSVAAEVITPCNSQAPILAVFLALADQDVSSRDRLDQTFRLTRALEEVEEDLVEVLPQYMVPGAYIVLDEMPMTTTDKIDRRTLQRIGGQRRLEDLASMQLHGGKSSQKGPSTDMERKIQQLWSQILGIEASSIKSQSSFLRIGGESISAMRLVAAGRQAGISFTVADIFRNPRLSQLAQVAEEVQGKQEQKTAQFTPRKPFSLLPRQCSGRHMEFLSETVEPLLNGAVDVDDIQDVMPATDFQSLAAREALEEPPGRLPHFILDLPANVDLARLRWACKRLTEHFGILRTVFIEWEGRVWQVLLSHMKMRFETVEAEKEDVSGTVQRACERDLKRRRRRWGETLIAFLVVTSPSSQQQKLVFRMSHAQFDDHSWAAMLQALTAFYLGESMTPPRTGFGDVISFHEQNKTASLDYWRRRLEGTTSASSSAGPTTTLHRDDVSAREERLSFQISIPLPPTRACRGIPLATLFHAACAIVLSQHLRLRDVVFGRLVTGRSLLPAELQEVVGPCLLEQPIRYRAQPDDDLWSVAQMLQQHFLEDARYEAAGMAEVIRGATSWPGDCDDFGWRSAFQHRGHALSPFLGQAGVQITTAERSHPPRRRPEVYATPGPDRLELSFEGTRRAQSDEDDARVVVGQVANLLATHVV